MKDEETVTCTYRNQQCTEALKILRNAFFCLFFIPALEKLWAIFNFIKIFPTGFYIHINLKQIICFPALKNEILPSGLAINT